MHGSYVKGCSIHDVYNRGINIYKSNFIDIENNALFNTKGHGITIESGRGVYNEINGNLVMRTKPSMSYYNHDQTPANFYIGNPNNFFSGNRAAGAARHGFWFHLVRVYRSYSKDYRDCPEGNPLGSFVDNVAHSS
mmetsp:Transcript_28482/g.25341  ORF Transcript_28482/g.25341 Transcript_28482/m.25341 type:complete len:136 (+) Transcript_28482:964-1371(+)